MPQRARLREHHHNCRSNFTTQVAGLLKVEQEMGMEVLSSHHIFYELLPLINTDKT